MFFSIRYFPSVLVRNSNILSLKSYECHFDHWAIAHEASFPFKYTMTESGFQSNNITCIPSNFILPASSKIW